MNFSEEKIILHTICVFQVEYKVGQKYSTYLDLQLVLTTFKNMVSEDGDIEKKLQKEIIVEKRRLLFNDIKGVATFKRIVFDECDYFSYCDMFLASLHLGHKLRKLDYDLKIFSLMDADTRIMHHLSKPLLGSQSRREVEESLHTHLLAGSILEAYQREVTSKVDYYHQLFKWY